MNLREFATAREIEYLDAIDKHGSQRAAAAALGVARASLQSALSNLNARALRLALPPGTAWGK
jgi:DNA-binding transcriptional LysR family regulator